MFARPGPRLVDALEFLVGLLHNKPELIPADFPWTWWDTKKARTVSESNAKAPSAANVSAEHNCQDNTNVRKGVVEASSSSSSSRTAHEASTTGNNSLSDDIGNDTECNGTADRTIATCSDSTSHAKTHIPERSHSAQSGNDSEAAQQTSSSQTAQQDGNRDVVQQNGVGETAQQSRDGKAAQSSTDSQAAQQATQRKWGAAPFLGTEIEEAHAAAIEAGQPTYTDPATGYKVAALDVSVSTAGC